MKLNAPDGQGFVTQSHDLTLFRFGGHLKAIRQRFLFGYQRMISCGVERTWNTIEKVFAIVMDRGGFAMHQTIINDDFSPKTIGNALMPQADAKQGDFAGICFDDFIG